MSELEPEDVLAETEIVHWSPRHGPLIGSGQAEFTPKPPDHDGARPAMALGAALAVGAFAARRRGDRGPGHRPSA